MASTEYVAEQRAATYAGFTLLNSLLGLILTYLLISHVNASAEGRIIALMCAETMLLFFRYWGRMGQILNPSIDTHYRKQIIAFGFPSMIALLGAWGLNESDKTIVANIFGLTTAGLYTAAASLAAIMASLNQSLTNAVIPHIFAELHKGNRPLTVASRWFLRFLCINTIFGLITMVCYYLFNDSLLPIKYANASNYFYALTIASSGAAAYRPFGLIAEYLKMAQTRAFAIITGGIVTIIVGFFGGLWLHTPLTAAAGIGAGYVTSALIIFSALWFNRNKIVVS